MNNNRSQKDRSEHKIALICRGSKNSKTLSVLHLYASVFVATHVDATKESYPGLHGYSMTALNILFIYCYLQSYRDAVITDVAT